MNHYNHSLAGAAVNTHLKIVGLALVCSVAIGIAFHASLFAAPTSKPRLMDVTFATNVEDGSVCRMIAPRHGPAMEAPSFQSNVSVVHLNAIQAPGWRHAAAPNRTAC